MIGNFGVGGPVKRAMSTKAAGLASDSQVPGADFAHASPFPTALIGAVNQELLYVNPGFCRLLGQSPEVLLGTPLAKHPQFTDCTALLERAMRSGQAQSHRGQLPADPRSISWSYSVWPVLSEAGDLSSIMLQLNENSESHEQAIAMNEALMVSAVRQHELAEAAAKIAVQRDSEIAERKKSEGALETSRNRLLLALDSAKASTWEWDVQTNTVRWSDEIRVLSGLEKKTHEASYRAWRFVIHPEDRAGVDNVVAQAAECREQISVEFRVQPASGLTLWMLARGRLGQVENGKALSYSGVVLDITERKHAEQVLLRTEKLAGVGRMAATLAHEINNPLDAVMNALYIVRTNGDVPASALAYLDIADEEMKRVAHMTRQSLGFYRESIAPTLFSVDTLLDSVLGLLRNKIVLKSIQIDRRLAEGLIVRGVFGELRQVFVNLIANSLDALDVNGTVALRSAAFTARDGRLRIRITVADNGKGIGALLLTRVFEPFFTTKGELGTGLGLWVTKQIVEKHDGVLQVRSSTKPMQSGTVFSITLPG